MDLLKLIKKARPNLKENSLNSYLISLKKLNNNEPIENLNYLKDTENIMQQINNFKLATQRNKLTAIIVVLCSHDKHEFDEVETFYRKQLEDKNKTYNDNISLHEKSEKQEANWTTLESLLKIHRKYKKTALENPSIKTIQPYLVSGLFLLQPPKRLIYSNMKIINNRKDNDGKTNYLLNMGRNKKYFILNSYKTIEKHGKKEVLIPKDINTIINMWLKVNDSKDFLLNSRGGELSSNGLGKYISKIFKDTGKKITINLLRSIYISENVNLDVLKKNAEIADGMNHGVQVQQSVYLKK